MENPLSFEEWCSDSNIEQKYEAFHAEYGDAAGQLSDYKRVHYDQYVQEFKAAQMLESGVDEGGYPYGVYIDYDHDPE